MSQALLVVIPVFNESQALERHLAVIRSWLERTGETYRIVLVDDGSKDATWPLCRHLAETVPHLEAIKLTRNFGKEAAILCGLRTFREEAAIVMDSDLEHPPELIPRMVELWRKSDFEVVEAVKSRRAHEPWFRRLGARLFNQGMRELAGVDLEGHSDYKLLSGDIVRAYLDLPEANRFFRGLIAWMGPRRAILPFEVPASEERRTRWSLPQLVGYSLKALSSFSYVPLQLITVAGFVTFLVSFVLSLHTLWMKMTGRAVEGFATVLIVQMFLGSAIMLSLGVIGGYLARIYDEVKRRPAYRVAETAGNGE